MIHELNNLTVFTDPSNIEQTKVEPTDFLLFLDGIIFPLLVYLSLQNLHFSI